MLKNNAAGEPQSLTYCSKCSKRSRLTYIITRFCVGGKLNLKRRKSGEKC